MIPKTISLDIPNVADGLTFTGYDAGHEHQAHVPRAEPNYVHRKEFVREYRSWHNDPVEYGFMVVGPTGTGKSTAILALNALLNIPTPVVMCNRDTTLVELISTTQFVTDPDTKQTVSKVIYGSLAAAFKYGYTILMEEGNTLDPGVAAGMNEVIRGDTLTVEATGEVIHRHPMFRFIMTGNDWGRGDGAVRLAGLNQQNAAFLNRFWKYEMGYADAAVEKQIVAAKQPNLPAQVVGWMVDVAHLVRQSIIGVAKDSAKEQLDVDFSTRTVLLWAEVTTRFSNAPQPIRYGLEIALLRTLVPHEREVIERACRDTMGDQFDGKGANEATP